jgi:PKD repeat protein
MKTHILILAFVFGYGFSFSQTNLSVSMAATPQAMAASLATGCLEISNVTYTGSPNARGTFTNGQSLGLTNGVILSSGNVMSAPGPNNNANISNGWNNWQPGDATYATAFGVTNTDASVLEFEIVPHSNYVSFTYVFASEAYPEMIGTAPYGVGIFVNGPGVAGGPAYADENIAILPDMTGMPVNINTLNYSTPAGGAYYVNNFMGDYCQYDGYSVPLQAGFACVPCQTYTIKIVVCDVGNMPHYDTAILLEAASMESEFFMTVQNYTTSGTSSDISESCTNQLVIVRGDPLQTDPFPFNITVSGSATAGTDFVGINTGPYIIPANQTSITLDYTALLDGLTEGTEEIIFTFTHPSICDSNCIASYELVIDVLDNWELEAGIVQNDTGICSQQVNFFEIETYVPATMDPNAVFYEWNTGHTSKNITVPPPVGDRTQYRVTITDICNQVVIDSIFITNSDFTDIQIGVMDVPCYGQDSGIVTINTVDGMFPFTYHWNPAGLGPDSTGNIQNIPAGSYTVTVTDSVGCSISEPFVVNQPDSIYDNLVAFDAKCHGESNGSIFYETFNGVNPFTYEWSNGEITSSLSNLSAGTYSVTATDHNGCLVTAEGIIEEPDPLLLTASNDLTICLGQTVQIGAEATGGTPTYFYDWSDGSTGPNISINPLSSTIYAVQVTDLNGCVSNTEFIEINLFPPISLQLKALDDSICRGESTTILANIQGGTGGPYLARFSDGSDSELKPPPYEVRPEKTTTYEVWIDDFCGSPAGYYAITIHVFDPPEIEIVADINSGCRPISVSFEDALYEDGREYHWDYGDGSNEILAILPNPTHTYVIPGLFDVTLQVTSPAGCVNEVVAEEMIHVYPVPKARFHPEPAIASIVNPQIFFNNISEGATISTWDFGDGSDISNAVNGKNVYRGMGEFLVTLTVENEYGCTDQAEGYVTVRNEYTFYAPNAISPNSLIPENKYFMATGVGIDPDNFHLIIYDRWGTKVFETFDMYHPWDGRINGNEAEKGASFPWVIIYKDFNGEEHRQSGTVTVVN